MPAATQSTGSPIHGCGGALEFVTGSDGIVEREENGLQEPGWLAVAGEGGVGDGAWILDGNFNVN